jgi:hypothetical protein
MNCKTTVMLNGSLKVPFVSLTASLPESGRNGSGHEDSDEGADHCSCRSDVLGLRGIWMVALGRPTLQVLRRHRKLGDAATASVSRSA